MTRRIALALTLHNHQPVGNFGWVIAETYDRAYLPMLEALERHPGVHLALHYTRAAARLAPGRAARLPRPPRRPSSSAARSRSSAAAGTSRSSPRCRSATGSASSSGWPTSSRRQFGGRPRGAWLAERVWEPDLPTSLVDGRLRLDDPRRRPLPGGGDPRGGALGPVHDRRPGQGPDGLRHRAGPPLPDPVRRGRRRHRLPPRPRHRGRRPGRDDGRRRREVRRLADDLRALLGPERLGRALLRGARRRTPTGCATMTPSGWLDGHGRSAGSTSRPGSYAEMGEWALPADEAVAFTRGAPRGAGRAAPSRGALAARRDLAQLPGALPRDQRPPQADAPGERPRRRRCRPGRPATPPSTTSSPASRTTRYWHGLFGGIYLPDLRVADATPT